MYNRVRLTPEERKAEILQAAVTEAMEHGLYNFSIANVSRRLKNCSRSLIKSYFGTITDLQGEVIKSARNRRIDKIVAQAIAHGDRRVAHISQVDREKYLKGCV